MYQLRRRGQVAYEDLLREMETIEQALMAENGALAMDLMVLEAKLRERFIRMEQHKSSKSEPEDNVFLSDSFPFVDDAHALIPKDLPPFPTMSEIENGRKRKKTLETVGMAAVFALVTALGVFGLASILQIALAWIA